MTALNLPLYDFTIKSMEGKKYIFDSIRKKYVVLSPEEWVRQNFVRYLIEQKKYSPGLVRIEHTIQSGKKIFRSDIVVYDRAASPVLVVECKAPDVKINQSVFDQIASYNYILKVDFLVVTNGLEHYCCKMDYMNKKYEFLEEIPSFKDLNDFY